MQDGQLSIILYCLYVVTTVESYQSGVMYGYYYITDRTQERAQAPMALEIGSIDPQGFTDIDKVRHML